MLGLKFEDKLRYWKDLREQLETHRRPFDILVQFTNKLPISARKINPWDPESMIEPWHLIEQEEFSEHEIAQLTAYTLQLTDRFSSANIEIHISKDNLKDELVFLVYLDKGIVLGYENEAITTKELPAHVVSQRIYKLPPLH